MYFSLQSSVFSLQSNHLTGYLPLLYSMESQRTEADNELGWKNRQRHPGRYPVPRHRFGRSVWRPIWSSARPTIWSTKSSTVRAF